jgi:hypothetical protein
MTKPLHVRNSIIFRLDAWLATVEYVLDVIESDRARRSRA